MFTNQNKNDKNYKILNLKRKNNILNCENIKGEVKDTWFAAGKTTDEVYFFSE